MKNAKVVNKKGKNSEIDEKMGVQASKSQNSQNENFQFQRRMTPQMKRFCLTIAASDKKLTIPELAKKFGVCKNTIETWKYSDIVQNEIERLQNNIEAQVEAIFGFKIKGMIKILMERYASKKTSSDVVRKIFNDVAGILKIKNINTGRIVVKQNQAQGMINKYENMTVDELLEKEAEYDELLGNNEE